MRPEALLLATKGMRAKANFLSRINVICPVQSRLQKYFASRVGQTKTISCAVLFRERGVGHRHERWGGMRRTRQRRVWNEIAGRGSREQSSSRKTNDAKARRRLLAKT